MKKSIIITGHDMGYSRSINAGYQYIFKNFPPVFSEISILPNAKYSQEAVNIAKESKISVNLAFSLVNAKLKCLSGAKSLLGKGQYLKDIPNVSTWDFSVIDSFEDKDIEAEIDAQYQWFLENFGHKPSAIVSQKGEHGDPKVLEPMIKLAAKEKIPMRAPWWRWKANYGAQSLVESEGIKSTSHIFVMFKDWENWSGYDLEEDIEKLVKEINSSTGVAEVLFLPGFCDPELFDMTSISWQRGQLISVLHNKYYLLERLYKEFQVITFKGL